MCACTLADLHACAICWNFGQDIAMHAWHCWFSSEESFCYLPHYPHYQGTLNRANRLTIRSLVRGSRIRHVRNLKQRKFLPTMVAKLSPFWVPLFFAACACDHPPTRWYLLDERAFLHGCFRLRETGSSQAVSFKTSRWLILEAHT